MKKGTKIAILAAFLALFSCSNSQPVDGWQKADMILQQIQPPVFNNAVFDITNFGAVGDTVTDCTEAIAKAIQECAAKGGGIVHVPAGVYLTGAIHLESNINLNLDSAATLLFSKEYTKYLPMVKTRWEGNDLMNYSPFIYAFGKENIAITGTGKLDGNADTITWWPWKAQEVFGWVDGTPNQLEARARLLEMSDKKLPVEERIFGEGSYLRPNFIQFHTCKNILIEGITILRSPMWEIHPILSENITVKKVKIISHGPNNDGFDPESCKNILVDSCFFDTGDDCIAIKSGREEDGRRDNIPSENIIIRNSLMKDGHGGVVIGSEISGGCRNVFVENCIMDSPNLDRALRIKSNSLRGGIIEDIYMRNCTIGIVKQAVLLVNFYYEQGDIGNYPPVVRNIYLENITSEKSKHAIYLHGYERSPIENVYVKNCFFNGVSNENFLENTRNIQFDNVKINNKVYVLE